MNWCIFWAFTMKILFLVNFYVKDIILKRKSILKHGMFQALKITISKVKWRLRHLKNWCVVDLPIIISYAYKTAAIHIIFVRNANEFHITPILCKLLDFHFHLLVFNVPKILNIIPNEMFVMQITGFGKIQVWSFPLNLFLPS